MDKLRFPIFVDLNNKKVCVVGAGRVGSRRAEILRSFGADVTVIDPMAKPMDGIELISRSYEPGDVEGAFLCVAATDNREVNGCIAREAKSLGIPVSVADAPEDCDFYFPAICTGNGLVAGVVSDGTDHGKTALAAKEIRRVLEEIE